MYFSSGVLRLNYSEILETLFAAYEDGRVCGWDLTTGKDKVLGMYMSTTDM